MIRFVKVIRKSMTYDQLALELSQARCGAEVSLTVDGYTRLLVLGPEKGRARFMRRNKERLESLGYSERK
jgi:hypothetical protein